MAAIASAGSALKADPMSALSVSNFLDHSAVSA